MEVELNLHDLVQNTDSQLDWIKELYPHFRLISIDNPRTPEEIIDDMEDICPSNLHGVFLNALMSLPKTPQDVPSTMERYQSVLGGIFQKDVNRGVQSWVSELIQNSVDMGASRIFIEITNDSMTFGHNGVNEDGRVFTPNQLSYLFSMNTSTKMGDFTKIGQFGVGFKYWWNFFEHVEVTVEDGKFEHKLSLCEDFKPHKSSYFSRSLLKTILQLHRSNLQFQKRTYKQKRYFGWNTSRTKVLTSMGIVYSVVYHLYNLEPEEISK